jgi:hypothetical protein
VWSDEGKQDKEIIELLGYAPMTVLSTRERWVKESGEVLIYLSQIDAVGRSAAAPLHYPLRDGLKIKKLNFN